MKVLSIFTNPYQKGQYEYLASRRRQQLAFGAVCAAVAAAFVIAGRLIYHKSANLLMIPGLLMTLPFANFFVTWLAIASGRVLAKERREHLKQYEESGMVLYHLFPVDAKDRIMYLTAVVCYQGGLAAFSDAKKAEEKKKECESDIIVRMKKKGVPLRLKIYTDWDAFCARLADIAPEVPAGETVLVEKAEEILTGMCL